MDLDKANKITNEALNDLRDRLKIVEPKFNELVLEWVQKFETSGGNITRSKRNNERLLAFKRAVERFLLESGYNEMVAKFLINFDLLEQNQQNLQKGLNDIKLTKEFMNPYKRWAINNVVAGMQGEGLSQKIVVPLQNEMFTSINQGGSMKDLLRVIENITKTTPQRNGIMTNNSIQVTRDALGGYDGVVNQAVALKYSLDGTLYVGTLVKDSRPQCERWVNYNENGTPGLIANKDIPKEIAWAKNNGTGFIMTTTPETFKQNRGGYNCRHTAYPVRLAAFK